MPVCREIPYREDITKYEHNSARYLVAGKHTEYEAVDVKEVIREKNVEEVSITSP